MGLERRREIVAVSHKDGGVYPFVALGTTPRLGGECTARLSCFRTVILLGRWWPAKAMELRSQREGLRTEEAFEGDLLKLSAPRSVFPRFPPRRTLKLTMPRTVVGRLSQDHLRGCSWQSADVNIRTSTPKDASLRLWLSLSSLRYRPFHNSRLGTRGCLSGFPVIGFIDLSQAQARRPGHGHALSSTPGRASELLASNSRDCPLIQSAQSYPPRDVGGRT